MGFVFCVFFFFLVLAFRCILVPIYFSMAKFFKPLFLVFLDLVSHEIYSNMQL